MAARRLASHTQALRLFPPLVSHIASLRSRPSLLHSFPSPSAVRRASSFQASELDFTPTPSPKPKPPDLHEASLPFGRIFSDHQLEISWTLDGGWGRPQLREFRPLPLHPAALSLHHGVACFEGMKAFYGHDGQVRLFRPELNMQRLLRSALRLGLPGFDPRELLQCIARLVLADAEWTPRRSGSSLYIRPAFIATNGLIGFSIEEATLFAVLAPGGPFFSTGVQPIRMAVDDRTLRAGKGGVGWVKAAGNYAPTFTPLRDARARCGASQVLFCTDGLVGECAAMNMFFLLAPAGGGPGPLELVTPPLDDGTVLPGLTRQTALQLARGQLLDGVEVRERDFSLDELSEACRSGRLVEAFGTGTAVVVQPVSTLIFPDHLGGGEYDVVRHDQYGAGEVTVAEKLLNAIQALQQGRLLFGDADCGESSSWSVPVASLV